MPTLSVSVTKRVLDVVGATVGLCAALPLFPFIALAIRLDSRGPIFFAQRRANGLLSDSHDAKALRCRTFTLYKFRTMIADAERATGAVLAAKGDPRVTRVGRFLRQSRLDELPQLWNVLIGDMSLVGPRPERPELLENLAAAIPFFEERLRDVKPGLTGPAQVHLRYTGAIPEEHALWTLRHTLQNPFKLELAEGALADDMRAKLLYDLAYCASLESMSSYVRMELMVLLKTPIVMLKKLGE
jgi:lipopolysaccharide/colanic/teichoic acid biosynthesis glycosyltransferase